MPSFGRRLAALIEQSGLKKSEFARHVGLSHASISHYIAETHVPQADQIPRWTDALDGIPNISKAEARRFLEDWALELSPPIIQKLVADLRKRVGKN